MHGKGRHENDSDGDMKSITCLNLNEMNKLQEGKESRMDTLIEKKLASVLQYWGHWFNNVLFSILKIRKGL